MLTTDRHQPKRPKFVKRPMWLSGSRFKPTTREVYVVLLSFDWRNTGAVWPAVDTIAWDANAWRSWLDRAEVGAAVTDRVFSAIGPETTSRPQIRAIAEDADSPDGRTSRCARLDVCGVTGQEHPSAPV